MSDFARGGDNFESTPKTCIYKGCDKNTYTSKNGNELDTCKEHLNWLYETKIPKDNAIKEAKKTLKKIYNYLISIEHLFKEEK